eukprot:NODE_528_length_6433_cov_0.887907.p2 type:complete len:378 gc:universal NODE_528_length_6433_cov_0.887907:1473-340(-)
MILLPLLFAIPGFKKAAQAAALGALAGTNAFVPSVPFNGFCSRQALSANTLPLFNQKAYRTCVTAVCDNEMTRRAVLDIMQWGIKAITTSTIFTHLTSEEQHANTLPPHLGSGVKAYVIDSGFTNGIINQATFKHLGKAIDFTQKQDEHRTDTWDYHLHGTYCAAIIGSKEFGVAPEAEIIPLKIMHQGGFFMPTLAKALRHVLEDMDRHHQPVVINMSIGFDISDCPDIELEGFQLVKRLIEILLQKGAVIVKAAGNEHKDGYMADPINRIPGILVVGAVNPDNTITFYSNFGNAVNIFAPGSIQKFNHNIFGFQPTREFIHGTSFAAPYVAGAVAGYLGAGKLDVFYELLANAHHTVNPIGLNGASDRFLNAIPE